MDNKSINNYRVNLQVFEGPMDLLLYLIKKNDLQIADIPIAFILEEYLKYLDSLKEMNIDVAGEFLLMAAELAYIKSRMLLPEEGRTEEPEEADPRVDLVNRLLEYQRYKEAGRLIAERSILYRDVFVPLNTNRIDDSIDVPSEGPIEVNVYELMDAFARIIIRLPKEKFHSVTVDKISVSERIMEIVDKIKKDATIKLEDLFGGELTRYSVVITFLALLEMARLKMVRLFQSDYESSVYLTCIMEEVKKDDALRLVKSDDFQ